MSTEFSVEGGVLVEGRRVLMEKKCFVGYVKGVSEGKVGMQELCRCLVRNEGWMVSQGQ